TSVLFSSLATLIILYLLFSGLFEKHLYNLEKEKGILLAETIEPTISLNYFLGLESEIYDISQKILQRDEILDLQISINNKTLWQKEKENNQSGGILIEYPINDSTNNTPIGNIKLKYSLDNYYHIIAQINTKILTYLFFLSLWFITFSLFTRYLLKPLSLLADLVYNYIPGQKPDFSHIRMEPEIKAICISFNTMIENIQSYNSLLEQYKISVDESSIVSKMSPKGNIIYANDEFCRITGICKSDLVTVSYDKLFDDSISDSIAKEIWDTISNKKLWKGITKHSIKNNHTFYAKTTIVPFLDEKENIIEFINIQHDITQLINQQEQILRQTTDYTTGLPNRIKFEEDFQNIEEPKLAIIQIENYKVITDYFSYSASQSVLKEVVKIINSCIDESVFVYKLASGEFAILADKEYTLEQFKNLCCSIRERTEAYPVSYGSNSIDLAITAGISTNNNHLLSYASIALQHALEKKKHLIVYEEELNLKETLENNLLWTKKIKKALKEDRFTIFLQPIFNSQNNKIEKYECLVRMIDEDGQIISPYYFLNIAVNSQLYQYITKRVMTLAFETFAKIPDVEFTINLSPMDIVNEETVNYFKKLLDSYSISSRVVLEIVESEEIIDFDKITKFILEMKAKGCKIAVDDFGSGYSNFTYLLELNVDYIKVDGSIIKEIHINPGSKVIASTILNFSKELGFQAVAEYVHNEEVMKHAKDIGFDFLQGFHLGEPISIEQLQSDFNK
ncbi:MAG: EAL domain-containing protein, partial [Gammaproteobacteria bacterium]|nr:EAL domain-containing protein [Gammaproteobacteria bacterium]